jgi:crotonobetainyl-CoA:carnitine CoA-transferase CaiB-like acyl-CoA transferase
MMSHPEDGPPLQERAAPPADGLPLKAGTPLDLLEGVVVIDLTTSIAGPYCGQLLADLGATVIKIEKPGAGDDCRSWGPPFLDGESLWFLSVNRNKQGVALDVTNARGRETLYRMVERADVVLLNLVERAQKKLGIEYSTLVARKTDLIHVSITGFGLVGERADMPCYDLIAEGYSGVMDMTGEPDARPQKVGTPAADLLAGEDAAMATLAAIIRKQRTGKGCQIDISMVESMTRFMGPRLLPFLGSGELPRRSGGRDSVIAIYQSFETADLPLTLGLGNDAIFKRFWTAVGEPDVAANPAYATNVLRREERPALVARIAKLLLTRPRDEWLARFVAARVPAGPINRLDEVAADPGLRARNFLYATERNGVRVPQVGLGIAFDGHNEQCTKLAPRLGADTDSVLRDWLHLSDAELQELRACQAI